MDGHAHDLEIFLLAVGFVAAASGAARYFSMPEQTKLATDKERAQWFLYLARDAEVVEIVDPTTPEFLLAEVKTLVGRKRDSIKSYESKATTFLTLVGGGVGVFSLLAGDVHPLPGSKVVLVAGAFSVFVSLVLDVICIGLSGSPTAYGTGSIDDDPWLDVYNFRKTVAEPRMKGRIEYSLTEAFLVVAGSLTDILERKRRLYVLATVAFVAGVTLAAGNTAYAVLTENGVRAPDPLQIRVSPMNVRLLPAHEPERPPQNERAHGRSISPH